MSMDKERSPLLDELEKAKAEELAKLGNVPTSACPLLAELDQARQEEQAREEKPKKKRRHSLKLIQGGKKELK